MALERDLRFDKIVSTKKEVDLRELRGEIRVLERCYNYLLSFKETDDV